MPTEKVTKELNSLHKCYQSMTLILVRNYRKDEKKEILQFVLLFLIEKKKLSDERPVILKSGDPLYELKVRV